MSPTAPIASMKDSGDLNDMRNPTTLHVLPPFSLESSMPRAKKQSGYVPKPIPTRAVRLPTKLDSLLEKLAEHVHDIWARQRMKDGWVYGAKRNDNQKTHPGLVPYAELSEAEKEYDRNTARETLKAIVKLGYRIDAC
jgi:hypothetical protein